MVDMKAVFEALLPPGSLWQPAPSEGFDQFLTVLGENADEIHDRVYALGSLRDPRSTPILTDLEKEYGVYSDSRLTEAIRRQQLAAIKYAKPGTASDTLLQAILRNAGFDVYVRRNHPPVDPADILQSEYLMQAGGDDAFANEPTAIAGRGGGELVVNGPIVLTSVDYDMQAGGDAAFANEPTALAGYFEKTTYTPITYEIPSNPERWPYIFFITGQQWGHLDDWNMEYSGTSKWTKIDDINNNIEKNTNATFINDGIRSMKINWLGGSVLLNTTKVSFFQYLDSIITNPCTVTVKAWGGGVGTIMKPQLQILDPVTQLWISDTGTDSDTQQTLSVIAPNGVEAVRCGISSSGVIPVDPYLPIYFDSILIETENIARAQVLSEREAEFKRLILKYKPLDPWAGLLVDYV